MDYAKISSREPLNRQLLVQMETSIISIEMSCMLRQSLRFTPITLSLSAQQPKKNSIRCHYKEYTRLMQGFDDKQMSLRSGLWMTIDVRVTRGKPSPAFDKGRSFP